jgi:hypothetical protein
MLVWLWRLRHWACPTPQRKLSAQKNRNHQPGQMFEGPIRQSLPTTDYLRSYRPTVFAATTFGVGARPALRVRTRSSQGVGDRPAVENRGARQGAGGDGQRSIHVNCRTAHE